jgi:hypothetical protein
MKKVVSLMAKYIAFFIIFTSVFITLFHLPFPITQIFFYRGLIYLTCTFVLFFILILVYVVWRKLQHLESYIAALCIAASINLSVFIVFPVTFERSLSMFILNTLQAQRNTSCGGLTKDRMQEALINTYIKSQDALQKRIEEQNIINMIQMRDGCYVTTSRAQSFLYFSSIINTLYNIK